MNPRTDVDRCTLQVPFRLRIALTLAFAIFYGYLRSMVSDENGTDQRRYEKIYGATFYILEEAYLCRSPLIRSSELALTLISTTDYGLTSVMTVRLACAKDKTSNTAVIIPAKQVV